MSASVNSRQADAVASSGAARAPVSQRIRLWIIAVTVSMLVFAVASRLFQLDRKLAWVDEEIVMVLISSHTVPSLKSLSGVSMSAKQWRQIEAVSSTAPMSEVLHNLKVKPWPDQAPLYCIAARSWIQSFGSDPGTLRVLSVLFSIISFPLCFALALEMFGVAEVAWLSVALLACSPFQMLYAQECRQYSMWLCLTFLSWILLAKALKSGSSKHWIGFGCASAVSVLTHYAAFLVTGVGALVAAATTRRLAVLKGLALAAIVAVLLMLPWCTYAGIGFFNSYKQDWFAEPRPILEYLMGLGANLGRVFFDVRAESFLGQRIAHVCVVLLEAAFVALAYGRATKEGRLILRVAALYMLSFAAIDALFGGTRMLVSRYMTPTFALLQLCAASCIWALFRTKPRWAASLLAVLIASGAVSCISIARAPTWWVKEYFHHHPLQVAERLNNSGRCLWIGNTIFEALVMSRLVNDNVLLEQAWKGDVSVPPSIDKVFVCDRLHNLMPFMERTGNWSVARSIIGANLWELSRIKQEASREASPR